MCNRVFLCHCSSYISGKLLYKILEKKKKNYYNLSNNSLYPLLIHILPPFIFFKNSKCIGKISITCLPTIFYPCEFLWNIKSYIFSRKKKYINPIDREGYDISKRIFDKSFNLQHHVVEDQLALVGYPCFSKDGNKNIKNKWKWKNRVQFVRKNGITHSACMVSSPHYHNEWLFETDHVLYIHQTHSSFQACHPFIYT